MFKSKIILKAMFIVTSMILIYTLVLSLFTVPKIENSIRTLEEKNAKEVLQKVVLLVNNVHKDLESFKQITLQKHKDELVHLTETIWSIIQTKYEQSKLENTGTLLEKKAISFKDELMTFYIKNRDKMSEEELKESIKNYINIYRYNDKTGYFWINDFDSRMIVHPINPELNGELLKNYKDSDGVYIFNEMVKIIKKDGAGVLKYKWLNPKSKKIEDKLSYVLKFEPYNWIIGTGEYYTVLKQRLQKEVFEIIDKVHYDNGNYFFVSDYNSTFYVHPYLKGENFSEVKDIKGKLIIPPMVDIARKSGEGYYTYWWKKKRDDTTSYEKLSFVKDFPDWQLIIGTGIYVDIIKAEIERRKTKLMEQLKRIIKTTKFGETGYLYVFNKKGKMLIHPNKNLDGNENFYKYKLPSSNISIYDALVQASQTQDKSFNYKWDKPLDKGNYIYEKVSWVEYIPEFDWYIASSIYTEELKESAYEIRDFIVIFALLVLLLSVVYSFTFFKNLLAPIITLSKAAEKVSSGDYSVRCPIKHKKDEIGILTVAFNNMIDTIDQKTTQLRESNDELELSIESLKVTQRKLIETEKIASLGSLVAGVAHEINTPVGIGLTGITHFLDITEKINNSYKDEKMSQKEFEEYLKTAQELATIININLEKTAHLVRSFKQVAVDQTSEEKKEFNLKDYIQTILLSISNITKKTNLTINVNCADNINLNSYPGAFSQIISNLIINSIKHAYIENEKGVISIDVFVSNNVLKLIYKDDGKGISKEHLPKVFEPFFTTSRQDGGSGLGLNIIYNIVTNNLKGAIECKSELNKGVEFILVIPLQNN